MIAATAFAPELVGSELRTRDGDVTREPVRGGFRERHKAIRLGTTQKTVDYYERRTLNPTLDVIQKVAEALEVSAAQLIGDGVAQLKTSRKAGPTGKVQKVFEEVSALPRRQQEKIIEFVTAYVRQYQ